jgi:hypothetical protein
MNVPQILINNTVGPLPLSRNGFYTAGSTQVLQVSGSAWTNNPGWIGVNIWIDGAIVGVLRGFTNEAASHKTLVEQPVILHLTPGPHNLELAPTGSTTLTDLNDHFNVLLWDLG